MPLSPSAVPSASTVPFVPVVVGGDLPTYTLARAFHAELGVRTTVITRAIPSAVRGSAIIDNRTCAQMDDEDVLVDFLHDLADQHPGHILLLLGTMDLWIERLTVMKARLDERIVVPYPDAPLIEAMNDKQHFAELCEELDVAHPRTRIVEADVSSKSVAELLDGLTWPLVIKPADPPAFHALIYPGKQKVGFADDLTELLGLRRVMIEAGYSGALVVQERIPGGDEQMRVLTTYSDREGALRWGRTGHVLLEDHDPAWIGNPLAIIHGVSQTALGEAGRLLEHVGWTGYANFDLKVDPRDGREYFFELNPRLGRSHGYLQVAGHPFLTPYVREYVEGRDPFDAVDMGAESDDWLYAVAPVPLLTRYVTDPDTRGRLAAIRRRGRVMRPFVYAADRGWERSLAQIKSDALFTRNFARNYRKPVTT
ncbi:MAG: hypothetical protein Q4P07_07290 [Ornithinimicrobium sp.]|uniref:carboxylate--amine ligase n=1 Tax=Ornithinimicrobium sp. TaxID=1977084 RepID=UPI0026DF3FBA|nr:hypothetical protein [Ornithinimicrobium sp.]MDO5739937.1 hypothetical protein [Ornithinimicrobium sp.]